MTNKYYYDVLCVCYGDEENSTTVMATYEKKGDADFLAHQLNLDKGYGAFFDDEGVFEEVNPEADEGEYYIVKRAKSVSDKTILNKDPYDFIM